MADLLRGNRFEEWESVFVAMSDNDIIGYCTFLRTDYYPDNKYFPWISSIFVDEKYRGNRVSQKIIEAVIQYAKEQHFTRVYIPSDMIGFYEKYGFTKIDELVNYGGDVDNIFAKDI